MIVKLKFFTKFSTRKFYDIVRQQNLQLIPQIPEDMVLSKYLSIKEQPTKLQNRFGYSGWQKQKSDKIDYLQLLNGSPHGSIETFVHRNIELTLISTNYFKIDEKKFIKVIKSVSPDIVMIQRRPEYHLTDFQLLPKGKDGIFSDQEYLNQLKFTASTLSASGLTNRPIHDSAIKYKNNLLEKNPQKQVFQDRGFQILKNYASNYQTNMIFGQMPMRSYRQWIANSHTLMQLQQIFKVVCQRLPRYKSLNFTPYQMTTLVQPDPFLKINDTYMATLIQMLIQQRKYKKIVGVFGIVQNQAVKHLLSKDKGLGSIIDLLVPQGPKGTIVRDIQNLEIIQKHIILDVMFYGKNVMDIKTQFLHTTNAIIEKYGKQLNKETLMKFRYEKTVEYLKLMDDKIKIGEEQIKKEFVRETLRQKN